MDDYIDPSILGADDRFAIGQPVPRSEDPVLLRGEGHYSDDVSLPGQAYAVMVRSHYAHRILRCLDTGAALAQYDPERKHFTLHIGCQGVFGFRNYIAGVLGIGRDQMRVVTDRVGGSFGMKQPNMPEHFCILHAARELGRPVKWTDERSGSF